MSDIQIAPAIKKTPAWKFWQKIKWTKKLRITLSIIGIILIGAAAGLTWVLYFSQPQSIGTNNGSTPTPTPTPTAIPKDSPNPLNGTLYTAEDAAKFANRRPVAVMVENHVQARPQSGLQEADIIYEALAEGGITRFMALYLANQPEKIGPVRSARLHFVNWAAEYNAAYAHWGGSAEALSYLHSHSQPRDIDQFQYSSAFWRDFSNGKSSEHTGYTAISKIRSILTSKGWEEAPSFTSWIFKDDALIDDRPIAQTVSLGFLGTKGYAAEFEYQPETNDYIRITDGVSHVDAATATQLNAKTIVILWQKVTNYTDNSGHPAVTVQNTGSGTAVVIQDGMAQDASWSKTGTNGRTSLLDQTGKPVELDRGKIWVISAPIGSSASY